MSAQLKFKDLFEVIPKPKKRKPKPKMLPPSKTDWWKENGSWVEINKIDGEK